MKKLFISQPMRGLPKEHILFERHKAKIAAEKVVGESLELIDSLLDECSRGPIWCLGRSICMMQYADVAYFVYGWQNARGCRIEHEVAEAYGIQTIEEFNV